MSRSDATSDAKGSPLGRLTAAFAKMLGAPAVTPAADPEAPPSDEPRGVTPRGVVEARLFVGRPGDEPMTAEEIAAGMRDVSADDVADEVDRLNAAYEATGAPYRIVGGPAGYRMRLDEVHERIGDRLRGRVKPVRLSPATLETLSIVAYRQPIEAAGIDRLRGKRSGAAIAQLVRLGLVDRDSSGEATTYTTTGRFLRQVGLSGADQLPRAAEFDD